MNESITANLKLDASGVTPVDPLQLRTPMREVNQNGLENGMPFIVTKTDDSAELIESLEKHFITPHRERGTAKLQNAVSFIEYVIGSKTDQTKLFYTADSNAAKFTAVFNGHAPAMQPTPGWHDHIATLTTLHSEEWKRWHAHNGQPFTQEKFAEFIELNRLDIIEPSAARMLEIANTFQAKKEVSFNRAIRQQTGEQKLEYTENTVGTAGAAGSITLPDTFTIAVPVFVDTVRDTVQAYFRYRIGNEGKLSISYQLITPHVVLDAAIKALVKEIAECTALYPFRGEPIPSLF